MDQGIGSGRWRPPPAVWMGGAKQFGAAPDGACTSTSMRPARPIRTSQRPSFCERDGTAIAYGIGGADGFTWSGVKTVTGRKNARDTPGPMLRGGRTGPGHAGGC